jgi:hypothetical protein
MRAVAVDHVKTSVSCCADEDLRLFFYYPGLYGRNPSSVLCNFLEWKSDDKILRSFSFVGFDG